MAAVHSVESLSPESKVSRFCKEAGFMRFVEVGQYFVTKDTGSLRQFRSVACREYTLLRDDPASQAKGWIQGNMRIGPLLEITTSFQHFKYGIEIRIEPVNQDDSHSWVSFLRNSQIRDRFCSRQHRNSCRSTRRANSTNKHKRGCSQVKGQNKTSTERNCWDDSNHTDARKKMDCRWGHQNKILPRTIFRRKWSIFFDTMKRYSEKKMEQLNSTELNSIFGIIIHKYNFGLMIVGKLVWQQEEVRKEDISIALIIREQFFSTSVLFKDILETILLILCDRTMWWLELEYSITSTT